MGRLKLAVFDIDGTILTSDHRIKESTKEGMGLLARKNIPVILASARPPLAIEPLIEQLKLESFYIALNGALVIKGGQVLLQKSIGGATVRKVIGRATDLQLSVNIYTGFNWFIQEQNPYSTREGEVVGFNAEIRNLATVEEAHKILVIGEQLKIQQLQQELTSSVPEVVASMSNPNYLEIVAAGISKAHALATVSDVLRIDLGDIVAFGDGENDLPMLKAAGFGVAMGNAHPSLREQANFVTSSNDEDGVLEGILRVLEFEV